MPPDINPTVSGWVNVIMSILTAIGVVGSAVIALLVKLNGEVKAAKAKTDELSAADAKTDQHVAENYGTLNGLKAQVDNHATQLADIAKSVPPAAPPTVVVTPVVPPTP